MLLMSMILFFLLCFDSSISNSQFYSLQARYLAEDRIFSFSELKGNVVLIVNVASECGFTDSHYVELQRLYDVLSNERFHILAFPCNDYGNQEPWEESLIKDFIIKRYRVEFPLMEKITIHDEAGRHPVFSYLYSQKFVLPEWNFYKYLISHEGKVLRVYSSEFPVSEMFSDLENAIKEASLSTKKTEL